MDRNNENLILFSNKAKDSAKSRLKDIDFFEGMFILTYNLSFLYDYYIKLL